MHASPLGLSFVPRKMKGKTKGKKTGQGEGDWPRGHGVRVQKPTARARISEKLKSSQDFAPQVQYMCFPLLCSYRLEKQDYCLGSLASCPSFLVHDILS